jgi:hypothetical protein
LLDAILTMIGYYVVILTAAMLLIVVVVRVFEALSGRRGRNEPTEPSMASNEPVGETDEELAAAIGAVSLMLGAEKSNGVSAWSHIDRTLISPWKIASKSRRMAHGGR